MSRKAGLSVLLLGALLYFVEAAHGADEGVATPLSVESFFRNPDIGAAKLSPSGKFLAMTTSVRSGRKLLAIVELGDKPIPKIVANFSDVDVNSFDWVNDDRLVFNTIDTSSPLNQQYFGPGLYSVRRDGSEMRILIRERYTPLISEERRMLTQPLDPNHVLLRTLQNESDEVIVGEYHFVETGELDAIIPKRLNTVTGRAVPIALGAPARVFGWVFDVKGQPRAAYATYRGRSEIFWREAGQDGWKSIAQFPSTRPAFTPLAVDDAGQLLIAAPGPNGQSVLKRFDFATGKPSVDPLVSARGFDLRPSLRLETATNRLEGVRYETDAPATLWFDPALKALQAMTDQRFPGRINDLQCRNCKTDGDMLVFSHSDQDPGTYYLYRTSSKRWETIGKARSNIDPARMAQVDFYRTKARDGEDLPIWVTTPPGKTDKPRAAVVLVHGGPWVRGGHWAWDPDAQFLASRGYVVLEPEFRGSAGYGRAHFEKGFKQWGLTMQDDLADAVQWATTKGLVDPHRVCIAGASYGGYATLMGLVRNPETYKCGVAWLAVTDPRLLFANTWTNDMSQESQLYSMPTMIGDPVADAALLKEAAPIEHAKDIRAPLLMAFGSNDRRVPIEHGSNMRDAMRSAGLKPEYVVYSGEGHGFLKVENRVDFYTRMEHFLAQQLQ